MNHKDFEAAKRRTRNAKTVEEEVYTFHTRMNAHKKELKKAYNRKHKKEKTGKSEL